MITIIHKCINCKRKKFVQKCNYCEKLFCLKCIQVEIHKCGEIKKCKEIKISILDESLKLKDIKTYGKNSEYDN